MHLCTLIKFPPEHFTFLAEHTYRYTSYLSLSSFQLIYSLSYVCGPLLESLHYVHISAILRSPELDTAFQVQPQQ